MSTVRATSNPLAPRFLGAHFNSSIRSPQVTVSPRPPRLVSWHDAGPIRHPYRGHGGHCRKRQLPGSNGPHLRATGPCIPLHAAGPARPRAGAATPARGSGAPGHRDLDQAMSLRFKRQLEARDSTLNALSERQCAVQAVGALGATTAKLCKIVAKIVRASFLELESTAHERSIQVYACFLG